MLRSLALALTLGVVSAASLASVGVPWATQVGSTSADIGLATSALSDGSAIVTGYFQGTATFGSTTLTSAGSTDIFVAKFSYSDSEPDAFSFTDQTDVAVSTQITSNTITVAGITSAAAISVTGGEYAINGGSYTSDAGTVENGNTVTVRHTSSGSFSTATNTVLTIGGVSDTFTSTTVTDIDGDGVGDDDDAFPFADTEETSGAVRLSTTPPNANSSCSLDDSLAVADVAAESPGMAVNGIGKGISFALSGCDTSNLETLTIRIDLGAAPAEGSVAMKIDIDGNWSQIEGATIEGSVVTYTITDNGPLDQDSDPGTMADPVTVAVPYSAPALSVPALPALLLGLLSLLIALFGYRRLAY